MMVTGFNLGANDYLKKPFAIPELVVRMKALLGRKTSTERATYTVGGFLFTPQTTQYHPASTSSTSAAPATN